MQVTFFAAGLGIALATLFAGSEATYCQAPPAVQNGYHSGGDMSQFRVGSSVRYYCDEGYTLEGLKRNWCVYSRRRMPYWTSQPPTCQSAAGTGKTYILSEHRDGMRSSSSRNSLNYEE